MFRVTIFSPYARIGDVCRDGAAVRRYLTGRVADVRPEPGAYETRAVPRRGMTRTVPVRVRIERIADDV